LSGTGWPVPVCDAAFARIHGYTVEEMTGKLGVQDLLFPDDSETGGKWNSALEKGDNTPVEIRVRTKDGQLRWVSAHGSVIPYGGRPALVMNVLNITEQDIIKTYDLHANCYLTKPVDLEQFLQIARTIKEFWLSLVKLPPSP
jgi:PAS domain S-box-containing protein